MRVIATTLSLVVVLLLLSLGLAIGGQDTAADASWQGALLVLGIGAVAFALRFVPDGPIGADRMDAKMWDDPESFWGRWNRFYREG